MRPMKYPAFFVAVALTWIACSSQGAKGDACVVEGKTDTECQSGLVCANDTSNIVKCLKICTVQSDCTGGTDGGTEECNGVSNSTLKACRTKAK